MSEQSDISRILFTIFDAIETLETKKNSSGKVSNPPKGEIAPDAPWLKK